MEPAAQLYPAALHQAFRPGKDDRPFTQWAFRQAADLTFSIAQSAAAFGTRVVENKLVLLLFNPGVDNDSDVGDQQDNHAANQDPREQPASGRSIIFSDFRPFRLIRMHEETIGAPVRLDRSFREPFAAIWADAFINCNRLRLRASAPREKGQPKPDDNKSTRHHQADFREPAQLW
jgi:hypothetical protein